MLDRRQLNLQFLQFLIEQGLAPKDPDAQSEAESNITQSSNHSRLSAPPPPNVPTTTTILTEFASVPIDAKPYLSMYTNHVKSTIPPPNLLRPHTAVILQSQISPQMAPPSRPASCVLPRRPDTAATRTGRSVMRSAISRDSRRSHLKQTSSTPAAAPDTNHMVPMLMYSREVRDKIAELKTRRLERQAEMQIKPVALPSGGPDGDQPQVIGEDDGCIQVTCMGVFLGSHFKLVDQVSKILHTSKSYIFFHNRDPQHHMIGHISQFTCFATL